MVICNIEDKLEIYSNDTQAGRVSLVEYMDGDEVKRVKIWELKNEKSEALRDMWLHEIRQILKIQNYPKANNYLELLKSAHYDDKGFYIFYEDANTSRVLSEYLKSRVDFKGRFDRKTIRISEGDVTFQKYPLPYSKSLMTILFAFDSTLLMTVLLSL